MHNTVFISNDIELEVGLAVQAVPGMAYGGDGIAEVTVDTAAVVELLIGVSGRGLVLDPADSANSHNEDDEHEDKGHTQCPDDDVERVTRHVGQRVHWVSHLPLQV